MHLLIAAVGVSSGICVSELQHQLLSPIFHEIYAEHIPNDRFVTLGLINDTFFGFAIVNFLFARPWRQRDSSSPGTTLLCNLAVAGLISWLLSVIPTLIVRIRFERLSQVDPYIFGIYYDGFTARVGIVAILVVVLINAFVARKQELPWKLAWLASAAFLASLTLRVHWPSLVSSLVSDQLFFFVVSLIPVAFLSIAYASALIRNQNCDVWTHYACISTFCVYIVWWVAKWLVKSNLIPHSF